MLRKNRCIFQFMNGSVESDYGAGGCHDKSEGRIKSLGTTALGDVV